MILEIPTVQNTTFNLGRHGSCFLNSDYCFIVLCYIIVGPRGSMSQVVGLPNNSYNVITNTAWVRTRLCRLQKRVHSTRLAATRDTVYQLLAQGRWFSPGTPASSTTKTGRHDIAEILLKVALSTKNKIKSTILRNLSYHNNHNCKNKMIH